MSSLRASSSQSSLSHTHKHHEKLICTVVLELLFFIFKLNTCTKMRLEPRTWALGRPSLPLELDLGLTCNGVVTFTCCKGLCVSILFHFQVWILWWMLAKIWKCQCLEVLYWPFWLFTPHSPYWESGLSRALYGLFTLFS